MMFIRTALASAILLATLPAVAEEAATASPLVPEYTFLDSVKEGKNLSSFRLRYEYVDQEGLAEEADAWTLRSLIGWQTAPFHNFSIGIQAIGVTKFSDEFNDLARGQNEPGKAAYAAVVDPDNTDINQLYLDWTGIRNTKVRLGRQSVKLDNVRFIGNVEFRQVMQVFDGVAIENKSVRDLELYGAWFTRVKTINTDLKEDNTGILHATYRYTPAESITGYAYFVDQEHVPAASDLSSKTFGARLDGSRKLDDNWRVLYTAEYARQDAFRDGHSKVDAHYYHLGLGAGYGNWWARLDQEMLSSNNSTYGFRTPLGTNHLFQGWVDKFLVTPNQGIRDTFIMAGGKVMDIALQAEYHWIDSDKDFARVGGGLGDRYGTEWDVSAAYAYDKNWSGKLEYGRYQEDDQRTAGAGGRIRDTDKFWLTLMYTF